MSQIKDFVERIFRRLNVFVRNLLTELGQSLVS